MIRKGTIKERGVIVLDDATGLQPGDRVELDVRLPVQTDVESPSADAQQPNARLTQLIEKLGPLESEVSDDWQRSAAEVDAESWEGVDDEEAERRWRLYEKRWGPRPS
ncbi:MAG: hypothetical protein AAGI46_10335 [Planctomycetota bacterium]